MIPYVHIALRSLAVYLFMIFAIRLFGKRELAQLSVIDLVFILLISNSVQNAMVGPDSSLTGGLIAAGVLFVANFILKKLIGKYGSISKLIQGEPVMLIYNGQIKENNLALAGFTHAELEAAIRGHGVEKIESVDLAVLEVDGNISVLTDDFKTKSRRRRIHKTLQNPNATT